MSIQWAGYDHTRLHSNALPIFSRCIVHVHLSVFGSWLHPIDRDLHSPIAYDEIRCETMHSHSIQGAPVIYQINSNIVYQTEFIETWRIRLNAELCALLLLLLLVYTYIKSTDSTFKYYMYIQYFMFKAHASFIWLSTRLYGSALNSENWHEDIALYSEISNVRHFAIRLQL